MRAALFIPGLCLVSVFLAAACAKKKDGLDTLPAWLDSSRTFLSYSDSSSADTSDLFKKSILALFGPGKISKYDYLIKKYSRRYGFDWRFIAAQIYAESKFDEKAESGSGARGLMQVLPRTAKWLGYDPTKLFTPSNNINMGCYYNHKLYLKFKKPRGIDKFAFMLSAYNAGPVAILRIQRKAACTDKYACIEEHLPDETRRYVPKVFKTYAYYRKIVP
jgi:membrane-bound lytic murein transglycosylase F